MKEQMAEEGVISVRECPACGHHEVGFTDRGGRFRPLRPGQRVLVIQEDEAEPVPSSKAAAPQPGTDAVEPETGGDAPAFPWVPEPLLKKASFRVVFGVMAAGDTVEDMTPSRYLMGYMGKLRGLIAKEPAGDLAATLDRHFVASHLGAGTPEQIAETLWQELRSFEPRCGSLFPGSMARTRTFSPGPRRWPLPQKSPKGRPRPARTSGGSWISSIWIRSFPCWDNPNRNRNRFRNRRNQAHRAVAGHPRACKVSRGRGLPKRPWAAAIPVISGPFSLIF